MPVVFLQGAIWQRRLRAASSVVLAERSQALTRWHTWMDHLGADPQLTADLEIVPLPIQLRAIRPADPRASTVLHPVLLLDRGDPVDTWSDPVRSWPAWGGNGKE